MRSSGITSVREKRCLSSPFLTDLTHHRNRALNFHYREACRFFVFSFSRHLAVSSRLIHPVLVALTLVSMSECMNKKKNPKMSGILCLDLVSPLYVVISLFFISSWNVNLNLRLHIFRACFVKVWLLIGQFFLMRAISRATEYQNCWHEGFYCFKCYLYFLCTKWIN